MASPAGVHPPTPWDWPHTETSMDVIDMEKEASRTLEELDNALNESLGNVDDTMYRDSGIGNEGAGCFEDGEKEDEFFELFLKGQGSGPIRVPKV